MQLVIIAGGLGKRLRPITLTRPKALVPLVDRPQIVHIIERLTPLIAVNSPTLWGLDTISNLSKDIHVGPFVHGTTYLAAEIAPPAFLAAFQSRFGHEKLAATRRGYLLHPSNVSWTNREARSETYLFFRESIRSLAETLQA